MTGLAPMAEAKIMETYPPIYNPPHHVTEPFIVTDMHRNALVWSLPNILTAGRQVSPAGGVRQFRLMTCCRKPFGIHSKFWKQF